MNHYENAFERVFCHRVEWKEECWQWRGGWAGKQHYIYGRLKVGKKFMPAHRFAYEFFCGPLQLKHHIHHMCGNTLCVNPQHLSQLDGALHSRFHVTLARSRKWTALAKGKDIGGITDRQLEVLNLIGEGLTTTEIAKELHISPKCVEFHKTRLRRNLEAS